MARVGRAADPALGRPPAGAGPVPTDELAALVRFPSSLLGHVRPVLITTHVLSGALLGRAVGRPLPALLLGLGSHLALDRLPHWGRGLGWPPQDLDEEEFRVAVVDGLLGLALIALVARVAPAGVRPQVLAGIVGACAPDLDKPARRYLGGSPWPVRFDRLHAELQVDSEAPHRLPQDVAVAAAGTAVTLGVMARDAE